MSIVIKDNEAELAFQLFRKQNYRKHAVALSDIKYAYNIVLISEEIN